MHQRTCGVLSDYTDEQKVAATSTCSLSPTPTCRFFTHLCVQSSCESKASKQILAKCFYVSIQRAWISPNRKCFHFLFLIKFIGVTLVHLHHTVLTVISTAKTKPQIHDPVNSVHLLRSSRYVGNNTRNELQNLTRVLRKQECLRTTRFCR